MYLTAMSRHFYLLGVFVVVTLPLAGCTKPSAAAKPIEGRQLYAACKDCHHKQGIGKAVVAAPAIAGLPAWYVEAQLVKFRTGVRGTHPDDPEGLRMQAMSRQLRNEGEMRRVAAYIATLKRPELPRTVQGDATAGKAAYATCVPCHGAKGEGNEALKSPPIVGQSDWYLLTQLRNFKNGWRGADPRDTFGAQMRPMAMTLADDKAMKDVIAYISTLSP